MWRTIAIAVLVLAGCSGKSDGVKQVGAESATTTVEQTTTTTLSPDEAFLAEIRYELDFGEADGPQTFLNLASDLCEALTDLPADVLADDAANDTPETDEGIGDVLQSASLAAVYDELDPEIAVVMFEVTAETLCPEHAETITAFLEARRG